MKRCTRLFLLLSIICGLILAACGDDDSNDTTPADGDQDAIDSAETASDADADPDPVDGDQDLSDGDAEAVESEGSILECKDIQDRIVVDNEDETFDKGPYLMQPTTESIIVMWWTETEDDGTVFWGLDENMGNEVSHEGESVQHEVKVEGLQADTRYFYKVRSGGQTSDIHHFYTDPGPNQSFRFAMWGDNQNGPETFETVVDQMMTFNPHLLVGVGDHVQEGDQIERWKSELFGPLRELSHEVAFYAAQGNHARNSQHWYDHFSFPHAGDHESIYSFTYGNTFFLVVNTNTLYFPIGSVENEMSLFVREQMASPEAQNATWRIALSHEPGYSEAWGDGSCHNDGNQQIRGWLMPLLTENNFHAYFSGHMHGYERGMVDGVTHIITGGGGGHLDAWCLDWPETKVAYYEHHHLIVDAGCDELRISAYNMDKTMFDWVVINKDNPGVLTDEGPMENLPDPVVNSDSPTLDD